MTMNPITNITPDIFPMSMSSREIAKLTGKRHDNVMRDIRAYIGAARQRERGLNVRSLDWNGKDAPAAFEDTPIPGVKLDYEVNPQNGQRYALYRLDKTSTILILTGYSIPLRARIIDRWLELEEQAAKVAPAPRSFKDALLQEAQRQEAIEGLATRGVLKNLPEGCPQKLT